MARKFFLLVVISAFVSAVLLLAGTAILDRVNAANIFSQTKPLLVENENITEQGSSTSAQTSNNASTTQASAAATVTVSDLIANSAEYYGKIVTVAGIATPINDDEFLLNDGTGQIIIDLEDDQVSKLNLLSDATITVTGKFESDDSYLDIDACMIVSGSATYTLSSCSSDDSFDDNSNDNDDDFNDNDDDSNDNDDDANDNDDDSNDNDDDANDNDDDANDNDDDANDDDANDNDDDANDNDDDANDNDDDANDNDDDSNDNDDDGNDDDSNDNDDNDNDDDSNDNDDNDNDD